MKIKLLVFITFISLLNVPAIAFDQININFNKPASSPYYIGQPEINIDAEEFTTVALKIKSNKSGTARLFWATNFDPQMNEPKSIWFFLNRSNDFKEYVFNARSQNPNWAGFVGQLLVFPENGPEGIEIGSAKAITGNFTTNIRSGWREFWSPRGRLVIGSTINTIQSSNLFGRSIYVYIYWLIGLLITGYLAYQLYLISKEKKKHPFSAVWLKTGKFAFFLIVVFWLLLEASSLVNNWLALKSDWKYFGKTYREKLVLGNTGDFYPFIEFCEANIPQNAKFDVRIPPFYNDIKAKYYLYPREFTTVEAEFLVVYNQPVEPVTLSRYRIFKTFRDKAFIMKAAAR